MQPTFAAVGRGRIGRSVDEAETAHPERRRACLARAHFRVCGARFDFRNLSCVDGATFPFNTVLIRAP